MNCFQYPLVWPSLLEELSPFLQYCTGIVLNAGSGSRKIKLGEKDLRIDIDSANDPDIVGDLHRIPLRDESVDTIVSIAVLEHTRYAWIVAEEFYRILRPGGFGIIAVPFLQPQHACPHDFIRFTGNGLTELMQYVGFDVVETKSVHHFGQTLAWLLWEYFQVHKPWKIAWPLCYYFIRQLSSGKLLGQDSPNTHNTEYVVVYKSGNSSTPHSYYLEALASSDSSQWFFPLLSCPKSNQPLHYQQGNFVSSDGRFTYEVQQGKPHLFPDDKEFRVKINFPSSCFDFSLSSPQSSESPHRLSYQSSTPPTQNYKSDNIISEQSFTVEFISDLSEILSQVIPSKVAILATTEYEGIFKNGGIGTYYKNLAKSLAKDEWYIILLLCNSQSEDIDLTKFSELKHIFLTSGIETYINLQPVHSSILSEVQSNWYDYQSFCVLFFIQAVASQFKQSSIYIEFPEMLGLGYRTIQAKQAQYLSGNCKVGVTIHSGHEWIYEANEKDVNDDLDLLWNVCYCEQSSFEDPDLAFFPSYFLKSKVESYGWMNQRSIHMPYFIPLVQESKNYANS